MSIYTGKVIGSPQNDFPFMAIIYDSSGTVIAEFPVRTMADGEAKLAEALNDLQNQPSSCVPD